MINKVANTGTTAYHPGNPSVASNTNMNKTNDNQPTHEAMCDKTAGLKPNLDKSNRTDPIPINPEPEDSEKESALDVLGLIASANNAPAPNCQALENVEK